jgi:hypothetical protein
MTACRATRATRRWVILGGPYCGFREGGLLTSGAPSIPRPRPKEWDLGPEQRWVFGFSSKHPVNMYPFTLLINTESVFSWKAQPNSSYTANHKSNKFKYLMNYTPLMTLRFQAFVGLRSWWCHLVLGEASPGCDLSCGVFFLYLWFHILSYYVFMHLRQQIAFDEIYTSMVTDLLY